MLLCASWEMWVGSWSACLAIASPPFAVTRCSAIAVVESGGSLDCIKAVQEEHRSLLFFIVLAYGMCL